MQTLPKSLNELFRMIKDCDREVFSLKGIYLDNFQSMLQEHLDDKYNLRPMSNSKFYAYSRNEKMMITIECTNCTEDGMNLIMVEKTWRDTELLKSMLLDRNMLNYEITDKIGGRNAAKELILVKVDESRHLFSQEEFEVLGYYVAFSLPKMYDDLLK